MRRKSISANSWSILISIFLVLIIALSLGLLYLKGGVIGASSAKTTSYSVTSSQCILKLSDLGQPDFTALEPNHTLSSSELSGATIAQVLNPTNSHLLDAAQATYYRSDNNYAISNGPLEVITTTMRFDSAQAAQDSRFATEQNLLKNSKYIQSSTGQIPNSSGVFAFIQYAAAPVANGPQAIEVVLEWQNGSSLNRLILRGRDGGTRLEDALLLASRENCQPEIPSWFSNPSFSIKPTTSSTATAKATASPNNASGVVIITP